MAKPGDKSLTRREFTCRAAVLSAGATFAAVPSMSRTLASQADVVSSENDLRMRTILGLYGDRFSDAQKTDLRKVSASTQGALERIRAFKLENSDESCLYLKPLMEREKKGLPMSTSPIDHPPYKP